MKFVKSLVLVLLALSLCVCFVSCNSSKNFFYDENYLTKEGAITASPYFAYYNDGKLPEKLEEIDPEIYAEGPLDDGAFNIYFAVSNNTKFDKKITEIKVNYIRNLNDYEMVEPCEFTLDNETYIAAGQTLIIPCTFEKEFVLVEAKLEDIYAQTSVVYEGCMLSAKETDYKKGAVNFYVDELTFTSSSGIEGKFTIFNSTTTDKYFGNVKINLFNDKDQKINAQPLSMNIDSTVKVGEKLTLRYAVMPDNVTEKANERLFDYVYIEVTED